jgi:hypothetical protein
LHGPGIFPHLRAGAARRQLSSKPKPGKPGKVPKHPENFRSVVRMTEHFVHAYAGIAGVRFERPALKWNGRRALSR